MSVLTTALRRPATYAGAVREAVNTARCLALYPTGVLERTLRTGDRRGDATHDTPVLLVHGYGHNRSGWFLLDRALRRAGFSSVHTMNYVAWGREGVPDLAARLARKVDEIRALTGADRVHVVGHSLGGVLLRWYVQELDGSRFVSTAITIASPHEGTRTAMVGAGPAAVDLRPGSEVMRRLAAGAPRAGAVRWVALYSNLDVFIQPGASAMLRDPAMGATNVLVKDLGHVTIMVSPVVARSVVDQLEAAETAETGADAIVALVRDAEPADDAMALRSAAM